MENLSQEQLISYIAMLEERLAQASRVIATVNELDPEMFKSPVFQDMAEQERLMYN